MTAIALTFEPWVSVAQVNDHALSEDAGWVRLLLEKATASKHSISEGEHRRAILDALAEVYSEASFQNWDGYGAIPALPSSRVFAEEFVALLPTDMPAPDISVDPDGEIAFEWDNGPRSVFSVSVGRDGTFTWAGLFGYSPIHGAEPPSHSIPSTITDGIRKAIRGL